MRAAVGGVAAPASAPRVALEPVMRAKPGLGPNFGLVLGRPARDQLHGAAVRGRLADMVEALLETGQLGVLQHARILPGTSGRPQRLRTIRVLMALVAWIRAESPGSGSESGRPPGR